MATTTPNDITQYVNSTAQNVLTQLADLKKSGQVSLKTEYASGEDPHVGELDIHELYEPFDLAISDYQGENKAFISALAVELRAGEGRTYQCELGYDQPGYRQQTDNFSVKELRRALCVLTKLVVPQQKEENDYVGPIELQARLRQHFQQLADEVAGNLDEVDTKLTFLATLDQDKSYLPDDPAQADCKFMNYRILDYNDRIITYCAEQQLDEVGFEQDEDGDLYGTSTLEDWYGIPLAALLTSD